MANIKLIEKDTDLSKIGKPLGWDVQIRDRKMDVYKVDGYIHTIGGRWGENQFWCCPEGEDPCYDNLMEFDGHVIQWGFNIKQNNYVKSKWGETEVRGSTSCMITRNGEDFYSFGGSLEYCCAKAQVLLIEIQEGPIDFSERGFEKKLVGRKIYWKGQPAVIERYIKGQACVMIAPAKNEFVCPREYEKDSMMWDSENATSIKEDMFSKSIDWFRQEDTPKEKLEAMK